MFCRAADTGSASRPTTFTPRCRAAMAASSASLQLSVHDVDRARRSARRRSSGDARPRPRRAAGGSVVMHSGPGHARGQQLLLQLGDQRRVFAMRGDDHAEFLGQLQRAESSCRRCRTRLCRPRKILKLTIAARLTISRVAPSVSPSNRRDAHVKGEVARALANRLLHPELKASPAAAVARDGQHISMSVVVPPTSAALLAADRSCPWRTCP